MSKLLLHRFSQFLVAAILILICSGGLVTSKGVGMAVPDWPTTYGYNMFLFPIHLWQGGIFHEHTHRLIASTIGFLTIGLCIWLWIAEKRKWLKWCGVIALFAVILQGVLGGLRVTLIQQQIGIFHACLAQSFLLLCAFISLALSPWWKRAKLANDPARHFSKTALFLVILIFVQLAIAASMRHQHAGLSIPDFPAAYGRAIPPLDADSILKINADRAASGQAPTSAPLIVLQFVHRLIAYFLAVAIPWFSIRLAKSGSVLGRWALVWSSLVLVQITLGAWTIWSNKAADVATAHVAVGAILFLIGGLFAIICFRAKREAEAISAKPLSSKSLPQLA